MAETRRTVDEKENFLTPSAENYLAANKDAFLRRISALSAGRN
jgi:hypothetical protein